MLSMMKTAKMKVTLSYTSPRILHALGDATGRELQRALVDKALSTPEIDVIEDHFCIDLLHDQGTVYGAITIDRKTKRLLRILDTDAPA